MFHVKICDLCIFLLFWSPRDRFTKVYDIKIKRYLKSHTKIKASKMHILRCMDSKYCNTIGTPYNTAPYITGSNIARLGHSSQNSWSKLWIPVVKSASVRVIFAWKVSPRREFTVAPISINLGTQWKQRHDSPWSYRLDVIVTFLWYGTISTIWHRDHQSTLIAFVYVLLTREHIDIGTPWILVCRQDGPSPCYQNNATSCRNIEPILVLKV